MGAAWTYVCGIRRGHVPTLGCFSVDGLGVALGRSILVADDELASFEANLGLDHDAGSLVVASHTLSCGATRLADTLRRVLPA